MSGTSDTGLRAKNGGQYEEVELQSNIEGYGVEPRAHVRPRRRHQQRIGEYADLDGEARRRYRTRRMNESGILLYMREWIFWFVLHLGLLGSMFLYLQ